MSTSVDVAALTAVHHPRGLDKPAAEKLRADTALVDQWRGDWEHVKLAQRRVRWAGKRWQVTGRQAPDDAVPPVEPDANGYEASSQGGSPADPRFRIGSRLAPPL